MSALILLSISPNGGLLSMR